MKILKTQTTNTIAYCFNLLSFIFQNPEAGKKIKAIYLFGSAVRGQLHAQSDIDLFIEAAKVDEERVQQLVHSGIAKFTVSLDYQKWKLLQFTHSFSIQIGKLQEWDLRLSIASEGILLYGKETNPHSNEHKVIFNISLPKKKSEYIKVRRLLFGRDEDFYEGTGLIQTMQGKKLSSTVFIIPKEEQAKMMEVLSKNKINFSMKEVILLEE